MAMLHGGRAAGPGMTNQQRRYAFPEVDSNTIYGRLYQLWWGGWSVLMDPSFEGMHARVARWLISQHLVVATRREMRALRRRATPSNAWVVQTYQEHRNWWSLVHVPIPQPLGDALEAARDLKRDTAHASGCAIVRVLNLQNGQIVVV